MNKDQIKNIDDPKISGEDEHLLSYCLSCGLCSSACPVSGVDGFDPRKIIRLSTLGQEEELIEARWPWICTLCGRCDALCPMEIKISDRMRDIRSKRDREKVPGVLHKGLAMALKTGNNLGLPDDDYLFILEDVAKELAEKKGFEGFIVQPDKIDANTLIMIHNKLVNTQTEDLMHLWKIFFLSQENWTVPGTNWEGTNWGYFTGDDKAMKVLVGRMVEHAKALKIQELLCPE